MLKKIFTALVLTGVSFFSLANEQVVSKEASYKEMSKNVVIGYDLKDDRPFVFAEKEDINYQVLYFFSYGCPHCYEFKPYFNEWKKLAKEDVSVHYIPVSFQNGWENLAKGFIISNELRLNGFEDAIYEHIHKNKYKISTMDDLRSFFQEFYNIETNVFNALYNSIETNMKIEEYNKLTDDFEIMGTPNIILITKDNKVYLTSPERANNELNTIVTLELLIHKDRKSKQ